jgi:hypothetical protein
MPKQAKIKKNKRSEVTQQDTFRYTQTIQPAARPVDYNTSVRAQNTSGGAAQALLDGLGLLEKGVAAGTELVDKTGKNYKEAGKAAAARGDKGDAPKSWVPGAEEAYIEGYQEMTGAGEGYLELQGILNQHAMDNAGADHATFSKTQDMEISKFFAGRTDAFTRGALPGAISLQRKHQATYLDNVRKEHELDALAKSRSLMDANIQQIREDTAPKDLHTVLRQELNHAQERGKMLGHHRSVSSMQMVNIMGKEAVRTGNPELMKFAYEYGAAGKIRVIDNEKLASKVAAFEKAARDEARSMANQSRLNRDRAEKDMHSKLTSGMAEYANFVSDPNADPVERKKYREKLRETLWTYSSPDRNPEGIMLTRTEIDHFNNELDEATGYNGSLFASESIPEVEAALRVAARTNPLSLTADRMEAAKQFLSEEDYVTIRELKAQELSSRSKKGYVKSESHKAWDKDQADAFKIANKKNMLNHPMFQRGPERQRELRYISDSKLDAFMEENKGRRPNREERRKIFTESMKELNDHPEYGLDKDGTPKGGYTGAGVVQNFQGQQPIPEGTTESQDRTNRFGIAIKERDKANDKGE